jgi:hypothetical protein
LGPTSQIAWENRQALEMMLAEKGGVAIMTEFHVAHIYQIIQPPMELLVRPYRD